MNEAEAHGLITQTKVDAIQGERPFIEWVDKHLYIQIFTLPDEYNLHIWVHRPDPAILSMGLPLIEQFGLNNVYYFPNTDPPKEGLSRGAFSVYTPKRTNINLSISKISKIAKIIDLPAQELRARIATDILKWNKMHSEEGIL